MSLQLGLPLLLTAALLQAAVFPSFRGVGGQPDLVLMLVIAWATLDRGREGMAWAFVGGLLLDLLSGVPLGMSSLLLVPIAYAVGLTEAQVYRTNITLPLLLTLLGALAYHLGSLLLVRILVGSAVDWGYALLNIALPSILFDVILILPALKLLSGWYDRLHPRGVTI